MESGWKWMKSCWNKMENCWKRMKSVGNEIQKCWKWTFQTIF